MKIKIKREEMEHGRIKFSRDCGLNVSGNPILSDGISVTLSTDGCTEVNIELGFLYVTSADVLVALLLAARQEHDARMESAKNKWLHKNGDKTEIEGGKVDLSINQAKAALKSAPIEDGKILHNGAWLRIYRTDLWDDVGICLDDFDREHLIARVRYGARISDSGFGIVSSLSDG